MTSDKHVRFSSAFLGNRISPCVARPGGPQRGPKQRPPGEPRGQKQLMPTACQASAAGTSICFFFFFQAPQWVGNHRPHPRIPSSLVNIYSKLGEKGRKTKALNIWGQAILSTLSRSPSDTWTLSHLRWGLPGSSQDAEEEQEELRNSGA